VNQENMDVSIVIISGKTNFDILNKAFTLHVFMSHGQRIEVESNSDEEALHQVPVCQEGKGMLIKCM
jgi:hypothetical protein